MASTSIQILKTENSRKIGFPSSESRFVNPDSREARNNSFKSAAVSMAEKLRAGSTVANNHFAGIGPETVLYRYRSMFTKTDQFLAPRTVPVRSGLTGRERSKLS